MITELRGKLLRKKTLRAEAEQQQQEEGSIPMPPAAVSVEEEEARTLGALQEKVSKKALESALPCH